MIVVIKFKQKGDFKKTEKFFMENGKGMSKNARLMSGIKAVAEKGVEALREATPKATGKTSESWSYSVEVKGQSITISWSNSNVNNGANIAMLIQYGHGTKSGRWIEGRDYINPALKPIFDKIADEAWAEVTGRAYY